MLRYCYRHNAPSKKSMRRVYNALRHNTRASIREIAISCRMSTSTVQRAIWALGRLGLITHEPQSNRTIVMQPTVTYRGNPLHVVWLDL